MIDVYPPPELHLLLGVVNYLYNAIEKEWAGVSCWAELCNIQHQAYHGGSFDGNSCRKLLKNVDKLRSICPIQILKFVKALYDFEKVVTSCFGADLHFPSFMGYLDDFKKSYTDLQIPVTPKVHCVFFHVKEFCLKHQKPLGRYSEQSLEAVHNDFKSTWEKYKVSEEHPHFGTALLRAVHEYNSKHV